MSERDDHVERNRQWMVIIGLTILSVITSAPFLVFLWNR